MRRRLIVTLAAVGASGAVLVGGGTAWADAFDTLPTSLTVSDDERCTREFDEDEEASSEDDFPSDNSEEAEENTTSKDARDAYGNPYYTHNQRCSFTPPDRDGDRDDESYDSFEFEGSTSEDNSYNDYDGYNDGYDYDREDLDRDHIGAPEDPEFATQ